MPDSTSRRGGSDRERINIHQEYELRDWARKFDVTPEQIRAAVQAVGDRAADVEMHLKGTHATSHAQAEAKTEGRRRG